MYDLILENKNGDQLTFGMNSPFTITEISGLNPPTATINTNPIALMDGERFNSSKLNMRQINVAFAIDVEAAKNRIEIFKVLKSKEWIRLFYKSEFRDVYIDGYIQSIDITYFAMKQICTCVILCPSTYFKGAQAIVNDLSTLIDAFHFPFAGTAARNLVFGYLDPVTSVSIDNVGLVDCGLIITIYAREAIGNPKIFDYITGEFIGVTFEMEPADLITIDTRQGEKTITLLRDGSTINLFNYLMDGSSWLQLPSYGGVYTYEVGTGNPNNAQIEIKYDALYEGV